jgi:hypothetical protein
MEPVSAFATIVGLLRAFKQEMGETKKADRQQFLDWLAQHRHDEIKDFIANTAAVRAEVDIVMAGDHTVMVRKLDTIQEVLATLLSRVEGFQGLSAAIAPKAQLSEQAVWILKQFYDSGDDTLYFAHYGSGQFTLQTDKSEPFTVMNTRFLRADLEQLVALGLLGGELNSQGNPMYHLNPSAESYLRAAADPS